MIKIEQEEITGWEAAVRGMRNPLNSWDYSDSIDRYWDDFEIGKKDNALMLNLAKAGSEHAKYRRMINVTCDITAPLYWWKEFDTYKVGTVRNSCSTMHTIADKRFELKDFSFEHMDEQTLEVMARVIDRLNYARDEYTALVGGYKSDWWQMIQLLPSSYNQKATVQMNYEVLANMYRQRKSHKLDEWREFCEWIKGLPHSEIITR